MLGLTALPLSWKIAGAALLALALAIAFGVVYGKGRHAGEAACQAANAAALAKQIEHDRAESARQIDIRDKAIAALNASKSTVTKVIQNAPSTDGCGPSVGAALDWLGSVQSGQRARP